jgi:hypothetical protein
MSEYRNGFDIDGVIYMGNTYTGVWPGPNDIIITGRSIEEAPETRRQLHDRKIFNQIFFNPLPWAEKSRVTSGQHKGNTIMRLIHQGNKIGLFFEDDPVQVAEIQKIVGNAVQVVHLVHNLTEKENVRHVISDNQK